LKIRAHAAAAAVALIAAPSAFAELAVSANDNKQVLVNAVQGIPLNPPPDRTAAVIAHNGSAKPKGTPFAYGDKGKLILLRLENLKASRLAEATIGVWSQGVAFSKDGKTILVQNMVERELQVFSFDGTNVKDTGQRIAVKGGPSRIRVASPRQ